MYVINGREFNITQIGQNKFRNEIKDPKEAQELAQLLQNLDKTVQIVNQSSDGRTTETLLLGGDRSLPAVRLHGDNYTPQSEYAFENNVTADMAFSENWTKSTGNKVSYMATFKTTGNSISDPINYYTIDRSSLVESSHITRGGSTENATVKDPSVVGMSQGDFLDYIRTNGLDRDIQWDSVEDALNVSTSFDNLDKYTDYAGALYASLESRIKNDFSGEAQKEQLVKLNETFTNAANSYADAYVDKMKSAYGDNGIAIDEFKVKNSVKALFESKKNDYRSYADQNTDYANLEGSDDAWLERDFKYMANALRNAHNPQSSQKSGGIFYNQDELEALGMFADMNDTRNKVGGIGFSGSNYTEETIGLALAMKYIAAEEVKGKWAIGDDVKSIIDKSNDAFIEKRLDLYDSLERSSMKEFKSTTKYGVLDRDTVFAVLDKAKTEYAASGGDAAKAMKATSDFAYKLYNENRKDSVKSMLIRYNAPTDKPEANFFHEFYDDGRGTSYIGKTMNKLSDFMTATLNHNMSTLKKMEAGYFFSYKTLLGGLYNPANFK